ncbi:MAG: hypothetical protein QXG03_12080 [Halalkalicoccus sp.]
MLGSFFLLTAAFHTLLAIVVFAHARRHGRTAGRWVGLTLLFGLGGVAGYLFFER